MDSAASSEDFSTTKSNVLNPINTFWLDTRYWAFKCDFDKLIPEKYFHSRYYNVNLIKDQFYLRAGKISPTLFFVQLRRVLVDSYKTSPDDGYVIEANFTLIGSRYAPESRIMKYDSDVVSVLYHMDITNKPRSMYESWAVKCVVKIHELNCLQNVFRLRQTELLYALSSRLGAEKTAEMALHLKRKSLSHVFSGRQWMRFAKSKCTFLEQTFNFVPDRAQESRKKQSDDKQKKSCLHLGYIYHGRYQNISKIESAILYLKGHIYGLEYLQSDCSVFMLEHADVDFIVDILLVADFVNDFELFNKALDLFLVHSPQIMDTARWKNFGFKCWPVVHSIVSAADRKLESSDYGCYPTERAGAIAEFYSNRFHAT